MARRTSSKPEAATAIGVGILIVDDDPAKLVALRSVLEPLGENIVEARSGADALRHLLKDDYAVILLDVRMPIMNGFETAELIRQRPSSELTPIIFVTALDRVETDMGRGYELGAVDFVFSPVVPSILRAKVQVFVELYRSQHELKRYREQPRAGCVQLLPVTRRPRTADHAGRPHEVASRRRWRQAGRGWTRSDPSDAPRLPADR